MREEGSSRGSLEIAHAGSLSGLLKDDLAPRFEELTGWACVGRAGGSRELARQLAEGSASADVFLSADTEVVETELMDEGRANAAAMYVGFATNALVIVYSEGGRHAREIERVRAGEATLAELLRQGLRLGRSDPERDPKGYRTIFAMQLLEAHLGEPGLAESVLGEAQNPEQLFEANEIAPMVGRGELDLGFAYRSQAAEEGLPFLALPDEASLCSPEHAEGYARASYRCANGTVYHGQPITYAAAMLRESRNPRGAAAFLVFLGTEAAGECCRRRGFGHTYSLCCGR